MKGVGGREHRDGPARADERHQQGLTAESATEHVEDSSAGEAQHGKGFLVACGVAQADRSVGVGVCAIAARSCGWRAATSKTYPPEAEKPQVASRVGSTPGRVAAWARAACQSASWSLIGRTSRGCPPLSPRRR